MNKKYFLTSILILTLSLTFAAPAFNSYAGASLEVVPNEERGIALNANGVFVGQYSLDNSFTLKGNFNVKTEDIINGGLFQDTLAYFTIKELSATYRFIAENLNQQASIFIGKFESFGSDAFIKKYFGSNNFTSPILLPDLDLDTVGIYDFSGVGLAYSIKLASPKAFGVYLYYNKEKSEKNSTILEENSTSSEDTTENTNEETESTETNKKPKVLGKINGDLRFSAAWDSLILDVDFGITLPIETEDDAGNEVLVLIRRADFHAGVSMLLGNNPITNLFLQVGILKLQAKPMPDTQILSLSDIYLYMEPRFTTEFLKCNVAFFCLPKPALKNLKYIKNPIGCNLTFASQPLIILNQNGDFGCHFTVSSASNLSSINLNSFDFQISPYLNLYMFGGTVDLSSTIYPLKLKDFDEFISVSLGYKAYLWWKRMFFHL